MGKLRMAEHSARLSFGFTVLALLLALLVLLRPSLLVRFLLARLRELQVLAALILISGHVDHGDPAQAFADGHAIGHHMHSDSVSARLSLAGWLRPSMLRSVAGRGYRLVLGSIFPWDTFHPPLTWMAWLVLRNAHHGAILVLHDRPDTLPATIELLRKVVPALRQSGYRFVSLDRLLSS